MVHQFVVQIQSLRQLGKEDDFFAFQIAAHHARGQIGFCGKCLVAATISLSALPSKKYKYYSNGQQTVAGGRITARRLQYDAVKP